MNGDFRTLNLKYRYRTGDKTALPIDFYNLVLKDTKFYKRAVGFFSSSCFVQISYGLLNMVKNNGKMLLITSPRLTEDDICAIELGYQKKEEIYLGSLKREMHIPSSIEEKNRLNVLANLISDGFLDIKLAITDNPRNSMYHEKLGLFEDNKGNYIVIAGSNNESETAINENFESFDVFCNWKDSDKERVEIRKNDFESLWNNDEDKLKIIDFPDFPKEFIQKYKISKIDYTSIDDVIQETDWHNSATYFIFPKNIRPRKHQIKAMQQFAENNFQCLYAMATGTGKTLTALFSANELATHIKLLNILIIVPLKDLVDQWEKDIKKYFSGNVIAIRSGLDWRDKLEDLNILSLLRNKDEKNIFITTYDSFSRNDEIILTSLTPENTLIIADEVHKFGAESYSTKMPEKLFYRIGLSATPKRPYDDKGTAAIFDYFCPSGKVYEFTIEDAINAEMLCHYTYSPILVMLTDDEMDEYEEISEKIKRIMTYVTNSDSVSEEEKKDLEKLLKQRHRIIERASNKKEKFIEKMLEEIKKYKDKTIIFAPDGCNESGEDYLTSYKTDLFRKLMSQGIIVSIAEYIQGTEKSVIQNFTNGAIDILFAKQRLNEGIDIPAARRAFFIASSTSEREFIQRRGRVLRLHESKKFAEIFDFVVVPPNKNSQYAKSIVENEIKRAMDFAKTADNFAEIEDKLKIYL